MAAYSLTRAQRDTGLWSAAANRTVQWIFLAPTPGLAPGSVCATASCPQGSLLPTVAAMTATTTRADPWRTLSKATGAFGVAGVVLVFAPVIAISGLGEPDFDGTRD